jgi:hypothetical protein
LQFIVQHQRIDGEVDLDTAGMTVADSFPQLLRIEVFRPGPGAEPRGTEINSIGPGPHRRAEALH